MSKREKKQIKGKCCTVTIMKDNSIDKDVQMMLLPLNILHHALLSPKYRIKNNFIEPNSLITSIISLCGTIIFGLLFLYRIYDLHFEEVNRKYTCVIYVFSYFDFVLFCIGSIINYNVDVLKSKRNISFVLKFQAVHRFLNDKHKFKRFIILNWISIISASGFYIFSITYTGLRLRQPLNDFLCGLASMLFAINVVYAIRLILLLRCKVNLWNIQVLHLQYMDDCDKESYCRRLYQAYADILECYEIYRSSFQYMFVYHAVGFFCHVLIKLQTTIEVFKFAAVYDDYIAVCFMFISLYFWVVKSLILEIILSSYCEKFYIAVNEVPDSCALLLKLNCSDDEKRLCKNIKRLHRAAFGKVNACGMFYVDATFPMKMVALITNYTVVLLQFAFFSPDNIFINTND